jgi:hypothetical protein
MGIHGCYGDNFTCKSTVVGMALNFDYDLHVGKRVMVDEIYKHDVRSEFHKFVQSN